MFLSANDDDYTDAEPNNVILAIKDTKLYVPLAILPAKDNRKISNVLAKDLKDQCIGMNFKKK